MLPKTVKTVRKPTSRGVRKHVRRMKQEARKGNLPDNKSKKRVRVDQAAKTESMPLATIQT